MIIAQGDTARFHSLSRVANRGTPVNGDVTSKYTNPKTIMRHNAPQLPHMSYHGSIIAMQQKEASPEQNAGVHNPRPLTALNSGG